MPGETYIQIILNQLNNISVRGSEDMKRMLTAIDFLERLKNDILEHKAPENENHAEEV